MGGRVGKWFLQWVRFLAVSPATLISQEMALLEVPLPGQEGADPPCCEVVELGP